MAKARGLNVFVVEDDLDQHKVIHDILEINLRDVKIDRVMNPTMVLSKLANAKHPYDLIVFDLSFHVPAGDQVLASIRAKMPSADKTIVVLINSLEEYSSSKAAQGLAYILKPFSLDSFSDVIKKICG